MTILFSCFKKTQVVGYHFRSISSRRIKRVPTTCVMVEIYNLTINNNLDIPIKFRVLHVCGKSFHAIQDMKIERNKIKPKYTKKKKWNKNSTKKNAFV